MPPRGRALEWRAYGDIFLPAHPPALFKTFPTPSTTIVSEPDLVDCGQAADIIRAAGAAAAAILASSSS